MMIRVVCLMAAVSGKKVLLADSETFIKGTEQDQLNTAQLICICSSLFIDVPQVLFGCFRMP